MAGPACRYAADAAVLAPCISTILRLLQRDVLGKVGCERLFEDTTSGAKAERVGLTALLVHCAVENALMSLIQSAKLNGHDPYAYLKGLFARLPHRWQST